MIRFLLTTLIVPLLVLFSINIKAMDEGQKEVLVKGALLETSFELPSAETSPDFDHALLPASHNRSDIASQDQLFVEQSALPLDKVSPFLGRAPPSTSFF